MSGAISGIYVEIKGDASQLKKELKDARQSVSEQAKGMSDALNNALSPAQIKNNINGIVRNLNTLSQASKLTGKEFGNIGVDLKELQKLTGLTEKELGKLQSRMLETSAAKAQENALRSIGKSANLSAKEIEQLGKQMGVSASSIAAINKSANSASSSMTMLGSAAKTALGFMSVYTVAEFGRSVMDAGLAMDSLQRSFVAVAGSQSAAAKEIAFLRQESDRLGQNFYNLAPEFLKLSAAAKGTAMEGENVRKMFSAIIAESTVLGLSAADTTGAMRAIQQMMSKTKITAEELRGQLGERFPDAIRIMAKSMGIGTAELNKMMEVGMVMSDDVLPKFADAILKSYGAAAETAALESGQAAVNRLSQAWTDFKFNLYDNEAAVAGINAITNAIKTLTEYAGLRSITDTFAQGAGLASQGLLDFDAFKSAGFIDRQKMVDEVLNTQKVAAKNFNTIWQNAEKEGMASFQSYIDRKDQIAAKSASNDAENSKKANEEFRKLTQTKLEKLTEQRDAYLKSGVDSLKVQKWYNDEVAKLNEKETKKHSSELKKQLKDSEKAAKEKAKILADALEDAQKESIKKAEEEASAIEQLEMEMLALRVENAQKGREAQEKAAKESADAALKELERQDAEAQKIMDNITESTADVFYDLFQDIDDGWESLWKSMKNWALRTLAEIAAQAATQQIVMPVLMSATGASSIGGAMSSLTGQGGSLDLGSLFNLGGAGGITDTINAWGAETFGGIFAESASTTAAGLSSLAANTQSAAASLAAAEASLTASSTTFMGALGGAAGIAGGLYQLSQGGTGNAVAGVGTTIAGAMAFTPAAPFAPLVAIGSQIAGSLFGEEEVHSPSVIFQEQMTKWGESSNLQFHTKDGADDAYGQQIADELSKIFDSTYATVETMLDALGEGYVEQLEESVVTWGRNKKGDGIWKEWDFGADMDMSELMAKATADIQDSIFDAAMNAFNAAGQDIASSDVAIDALANLSGDAAEAFKELQDVIAAGVQDGDVVTYAQQLAAFQATAQGLNDTWDAINTAIDSMTAPVSEYEAAVNAANVTVDGWIDTLENLGFAEERLTEIEARRTEVVEAATAAMITAFDNDIRIREAQLSGDSYLIDSTQLLIDQERELAEIRSKFGVDSIQYAKIEEIQAQERAALEQRYAQQAAEESARAQEAAAEAARQAAQEQQRAAEEVLRAAESAVEAAQADLRKAYDAERTRLQNIIDTHNANVDAARDALIDAYDRERSALEDTADTFRALADELADWRAGVLTGADSPLPAAQREALVAAEFRSTANRAMLGDPEALGELTGKSQEYIDIARSNSRTQEDYARTVGGVLEVTQQAQTVAERHASIAEQQLAALEAQIENLGVLNEELLTFAQAMDAYNAAMLDQSAVQAAAQLIALDTQVGALITINESVMSVEQAIAQLAAAQSAAAAAQAAAISAAAQQAAGVRADASSPTGYIYTGAGGVEYTDTGVSARVQAYNMLATDNAYMSQFMTPAQSGKYEAQVGQGWFDTNPNSSAIDFLAREFAATNGYSTGYSAYQSIPGFSDAVAKLEDDILNGRVPSFASGGYHSGGLRLVGENGPELEVTGPSRIWSAEDTAAMLSGGKGDDALVVEIQALRADIRAANAAIARNTMDTAKLMKRWDGDGMPEVRVA